MSRRGLINLLLAGLLLMLGALAYLRPGAELASAAPRLTGIDPATPGRVRLTRGGAPELLLERTAKGWLMLRPYRQPADPARVSRLLAMLSAPSYRRFSPEPSRLDDYGLAAPIARLEADEKVLAIGGTEPVGRHRYIGYQGQVQLIDDLYLHLLLGQPEFFLDRRVLGAESLPITSVRLPRFQVYRDPRGRWGIDPPSPAVDPERLRAWVAAWRDARALEVVKAPAEQGETVTLGFAGGTAPRVLELVAGEGNLLIDRARGLAYHLPPDTPLLTRPGVSESDPMQPGPTDSECPSCPK